MRYAQLCDVAGPVPADMDEILRQARNERRFPGDIAMQHRVSIIADGDVRMANLAMAGSHSINGVAELHTKLVTTTLAPDFHRLYPERFNNKTNGVTPRRWLLHANRALASLITKTIGEAWITDLDRLREVGYSDEDILHIVEVTAIFNYNVRLATPTGLFPNPEYHDLGRMPAPQRASG